MIVLFDFVTIFLFIALHQQVKKRRDDESFLDWFSCWTNSESLEYNSSYQKDILCAFSKKMKAIAILNKERRK